MVRQNHPTPAANMMSANHSARPRQKHSRQPASHSLPESKYSPNDHNSCSNHVTQDQHPGNKERHNQRHHHHQQQQREQPLQQQPLQQQPLQQQASLPRYRANHDPLANNNKGIPHSYSMDSGANAMMSPTDSDGVMQHVRRKVSSNLEHYGNLLHDMAFPILFRRDRNRSSSGSRTREGKRSGSKEGHHRNSSLSRDRNSDNDENFVFVENIELHHMDGFTFSSQREIGKGHKFGLIQLNAPTWCDKCGDFIWGVYKQCLCCQNCQYTCHHKCRPLVTLDCASVAADGKNAERPSRNRSETALVGAEPGAVRVVT